MGLRLGLLLVLGLGLKTTSDSSLFPRGEGSGSVEVSSDEDERISSGSKLEKRGGLGSRGGLSGLELTISGSKGIIRGATAKLSEYPESKVGTGEWRGPENEVEGYWRFGGVESRGK